MDGIERGGISRRRALRRLAAGSVGAATAALWPDTLGALAREQAAHAHAVIASAEQTAAGWAPKILNRHQLDTVATLSELIIPQTDTPGARAVFVDRFIDTVLQDATKADRDRFLRSLAWMDARSKKLFGKEVLAATPAQQTELLTALAAEPSREDPAGVAFFIALKAMTITGYYTSKVGLEQELGDDGVLVQGTFEGCTHKEHQG